MGDLPEIRNPLSSAKLVGVDVEYETYSKQTVPRGHPAYVVGRSDLAEFATCPHKWQVGAKEEDEDSRQTEWGQAFEEVVMYPGEMDTRCAVKPATYRNDKGEVKDWTFAANVCKRWREEALAAGKRIVEPEVIDAAKVFLNDEQIAVMVGNSQKQVMVIGEYHDEVTNLVVPVKGLIDLVPSKEHLQFRKCLADIKTARNAAPMPWRREIATWFLHWQAALYLDLYTLATGEDRLEFRHIISENVAPYEVGKRIMSEDFVTLGRMGYREALKRYCRCLKAAAEQGPSYQWPGYDTSEAGTIIDGWLLSQPDAWMVKQA